MVTTLLLNSVPLEVFHYQEVKASGRKRRNISFVLKVTSEAYHDIAVLLYEQTFKVEVPKQEVLFWGTITNYSTSMTNLYHADKVSDFFVEITELAEAEMENAT